MHTLTQYGGTENSPMAAPGKCMESTKKIHFAKCNISNLYEGIIGISSEFFGLYFSRFFVNSRADCTHVRGILCVQRGVGGLSPFFWQGGCNPPHSSRSLSLFPSSKKSGRRRKSYEGVILPAPPTQKGGGEGAIQAQTEHKLLVRRRKKSTPSLLLLFFSFSSPFLCCW